LPVSQKIMREHGGEIRVESTPGAGSRFILELPAAGGSTGRQTEAFEALPPS
jgi:signal transduction histidine kinase